MKNIKGQLSMINVQCTMFYKIIFNQDEFKLILKASDVIRYVYWFPGQKHLFVCKGYYFFAGNCLYRDPDQLFDMRGSLCNGPESLCA